MKRLQINANIIACEDPIVQSCLCSQSGKDEKSAPKYLIHTQHTYNKQELIYLSSQTNNNLYILAAGCCKEYLINDEGDEVINNFYYPGDVIGLESLYVEKSQLSVCALQTTRLYVLPLSIVRAKLELMAGWLLERYILQHRSQLWLSHRTAAQARVAAFFVKHILAQSEPALPIELPMTLTEIGHYIGLAPETISRQLRALKLNHWLTINGKHEILQYDLAALKHLAASESL